MTGTLPSHKLLNDFCSEIVVFSNQIKKAAFESMATDSVLSVGQAVLELLSERGAMTVPAIADQRSSSRQNIQIMVNRLLRMGFVHIEPNPNHKRSSLVSITEKGLSALRQATEANSTLIHQLAEHYSEKELARSLEFITRLRRVLDGEEKPPRKARVKAQAAASDNAEAHSLGGSSQSHESPVKAEKESAPDHDENSLPYNLL